MAAAKKTAGKAIAKKASTSTALKRWDEELAQHAAEYAEKEIAPAGQKISVRGGVLSIGGQPVKGNVAQVVIFDSAYINALYEGKFDPDNPNSPTCFAMNRDGDELAPHEESTDPKNEQCEGCEFNAFGSADTGRGKACKNGRRLGLIAAADLTAESVADQDAFYLDVPVTSVKGWAYYVKGLAAQVKRPPWAVVTEIGVVPDPKTQFRVTFTIIESIEDGDILQAIKDKRDASADAIMFPFPKAQAREAAAPARSNSKLSARGGAKAAPPKAAAKMPLKKPGGRR